MMMWKNDWRPFEIDVEPGHICISDMATMELWFVTAGRYYGMIRKLRNPYWQELSLQAPLYVICDDPHPKLLDLWEAKRPLQWYIMSPHTMYFWPKNGQNSQKKNVHRQNTAIQCRFKSTVQRLWLSFKQIWFTVSKKISKNLIFRLKIFGQNLENKNFSNPLGTFFLVL